MVTGSFYFNIKLTNPRNTATPRAPKACVSGGLDAQGRALERGSVLIFSIWNSDGDFMNWMDSGDAGPCNATEGNPELILANQPDTHVVFSNVRWGDIDSTTS